MQTVAGLIDFWSKDHTKFYPWGFAMNGQIGRLETTRRIIFALGIKRIIETGTFRGTTTEWFSQFGLPVETVELNQRYFAFSKVRLSGRNNVRLHLDSSVAFLKKIVREETRNDAHLFYLDAHWEKQLPLREELQLIFNNIGRAVVIVDDFKVEDDLGYGFDSFSPEMTLDLTYVKNSALPPLFGFFPSIGSQHETGMRRGWIVLTTDRDFAEKLKQIDLLRLIDL
jgi:hypothetical protein